MVMMLFLGSAAARYLAWGKNIRSCETKKKKGEKQRLGVGSAGYWD